MLRAIQKETKGAYMVSLRESMDKRSNTTMRKMRSMHKQKNTGMDIQVRQ